MGEFQNGYLRGGILKHLEFEAVIEPPQKFS